MFISLLATASLATVTFAASIPVCPALPSRTPPTSVQDLRPDEVKVITALGDSITAAFAAKQKTNTNAPVGFGDLTEYRGKSFSIGGDTGIESIGNYMASYRPDLVGRSKGQRGILFPSPSVDGFNAARTGAVITGLQAQANSLVTQLQRTSSINYNNDFKFMTLFIGANDVCNSCNNAVDPDKWANELRKVLNDLETRVPRLIVNIPQLFKVSELWDLTEADDFCDRRRASPLTAECTCAFLTGANGVAKRAAMDALTVELNKRLVDIRNEYKQKSSASFMMTTDPASAAFSLVDYGMSYLSNTDCFHPSELAHSLLARVTWNNLFKDYESKEVNYNADTQITCLDQSARFKF